MKAPSPKKVPSISTPEAVIKRRIKEAKKKDSIKTFFIRLVFFVIFVWILFGVVFGIRVMKNDDMMPRISAGDILLFYRLNTIYRQDDVVVFTKDGTHYAGRIVAQGGDTVEVTPKAALKVNGNLIIESNIYFETPQYEGGISFPVTLADDEFFILGDQRNGARDSRYLGPVSRDDLDGKIITVIRRSSL